ncbi:MAG: Ca-activated chloride channel [Acidobacteriota bacterium]|nr:Ca-activated chloride channel [Acidobacteriota bacterium]
MNPRRSPHAPRQTHPRRAAAHPFPLALLLYALLPFIIHAQTPQPTPSGDEEVLSVRTDLILLRLFVTDSHSHRVTGLAQSDFEVRDNGRAVALNYFAPGTSRAAFVFALDASGSVRENVARQREAATALLSRFGQSARAAVVTFAERPTLALPFTTDAGRVLAAFQIEAQPERRTAIFDATLAALRAFDTARQDAAERRIVVLISDGLDNISQARPASVIEEARARGVSIYVVHFPLYEPRGEHLGVRTPARGFRDLAERTGGAYFLLADPSHGLDPRFSYDLNPVFKAIADDLQSQYELGFYPDDAARRQPEHKLEVTPATARNRKLRVHSLRDAYTLRP